MDSTAFFSQGYSTASGRFFGGVVEYIASGMPRYHSKGAVSLKRLHFHFRKTVNAF